MNGINRNDRGGCESFIPTFSFTMTTCVNFNRHIFLYSTGKHGSFIQFPDQGFDLVDIFLNYFWNLNE